MSKLKEKSKKSKEKSKKYYDLIYKKKGLEAQRRYPNEELCRFFGRNFFHIDKKKRKHIKVLETGCGSCGNLWMIAKEGFAAYGIDFSNEAIKVAKKFFKKQKLKGFFTKGDFTSMNYKNNFFNCVVDVFSSCCLSKIDGERYIKDVNRILKKNGKFFTYFSSKKSDMFKFSSRKMLDKDTLISLKQKSAFKVDHAQRFMGLNQYCDLLLKNGFKVEYKEELMRTYFFTREKFYFNVIEAKKF